MLFSFFVFVLRISAGVFSKYALENKIYPLAEHVNEHQAFFEWKQNKLKQNFEQKTREVFAIILSLVTRYVCSRAPEQLIYQFSGLSSSQIVLSDGKPGT